MRRLRIALSLFILFFIFGCDSITASTNQKTSEITTEELITEGTTSNDQITVIEKFTLTILDFDDTVLYEEEHDYNANLSDLIIDEPDRVGYTFSGWNQSIPSTMPNSNLVIKATYVINEYTITWKDADDSILGTTMVSYGSLPTYDLPNDTERYNYTGWTPNIEIATEDAIYKAVRVDTKYVISNQVLIDNEFLNITIVNAHEDTIFGFELNVSYENKTSDKELMFSLGSTVINGYLIDSLWADILSAGEKVTDTIYFSSSDLKKLEILWVEKIEMQIRAYDSEDWQADYLVDEKFVIYPTGLTEEEFVIPNRPTNENEVVLVDNEYLSIIILENYIADIWGYTLVAYLENKTSDTEMMFSLEDIVVNGYRIDVLWAESLPAETRAISEIHFSSNDMDASGIVTVDKVELYTRVYDANDWLEDDLINDKFVIYPTGLTEEEIVIPNRPTNDNEVVLVDDEELKVFIIESYEDNIWGYNILLYIENNTDQELMFTWEDVSINGYSIDPYWATTLKPGIKEVTSVTFFESDLEDNDITVINQIEFKLKIYDYNDWLADDIINQIFVYNPE